jgi:hypothetical protein
MVEFMAWIQQLNPKSKKKKLIVSYSPYTLYGWDHTRPCDRNIFYDTMDKHLNAQPVWALKNWLRVYRPLVKHIIKEAVRLAIRNMQTIQSYFCQAKVPD